MFLNRGKNFPQNTGNKDNLNMRLTSMFFFLSIYTKPMGETTENYEWLHNSFIKHCDRFTA